MPTLYPSTPVVLPGTVPVLSDHSYSIFDHLFYPAVRSPTLLLAGQVPHLGLVLGGADRLEIQRWMLSGYWQPGNDTHKSHYAAAAGYVNNMLAPVSVIAQGSFIDWRSQSIDDTDPMNTITYDEEHRTRDASAAISYTYRGSLFTTLGGVYTDDFAQVDTLPSSRLHLGGPSATVEWYSAESTRYTGPRRALLANAAIAYYPRQWSTFMGNITDVAGTLGTTLPLPFGRRHTISAFARARSLLAPDDTGLLQVGGDSALGILWNRSNKMEPPDFDTSRFPPNLRFVEPLRGFEDFGIAAERVKLGEVSWKYPLIIDRGTAASLFVLPASFLRQLDLELFASGAIVDASDRHYAVGAATTLHIQFLRIPLVVMYQIARRLTDDEALTHLIAIGPDI
ncbi:MAG TPA: hypothetical protein VFV99_32990 [Kofleriaceae bacterium]|nr:hypothetical protein [Kofleriaceae bacterium]